MGIQVKGAYRHTILSIPFNCLYWADKLTVGNGNPVETWTDAKGSYDALSATATDAVLTTGIAALNGHSAVTFNGSAVGYQNMDFVTSQPITIIGVWNVTADGKSSYLIGSADAVAPNSSFYWRMTRPIDIGLQPTARTYLTIIGRCRLLMS